MTKENDAANALDFEPVLNYRVSEAIYEQIRNKIINGELKPNDRLPSERKLIEIFRRSRPTIREALRMLESAGLIEIIPGSGGAVVQEISAATVTQPLGNMILLKRIRLLELYEFRIINETAYVQWTAERRTEGDIKKMQNILKQMHTLKGDWETLLRYDSEFHKTIAECSRNEMAKIIYNVITKPVRDIMYAKMGELTIKQQEFHKNQLMADHDCILEAIINQDVDKVKELMIDHLNHFKHLIEDE